MRLFVSILMSTHSATVLHGKWCEKLWKRTQSLNGQPLYEKFKYSHVERSRYTMYKNSLKMANSLVIVNHYRTETWVRNPCIKCAKESFWQNATAIIASLIDRKVWQWHYVLSQVFNLPSAISLLIVQFHGIQTPHDKHSVKLKSCRWFQYTISSNNCGTW